MERMIRAALCSLFLCVILVACRAPRACAALPADFDLDAFISEPFAIPMERVVKWSREGRSHDDNQALAFDLAVEFARSRDARYAQAALKIFSAYAEHYNALEAKFHNDRNGGSLHAQLLDEAKWLVLMAEAYELLLAGGAVPEDAHRAIVQGLFEPAVAVEMGGSMPNNHQWWFNAAIGVCGFVLDRPEWVDAAVNGERGFRAHLASHINDDGYIFELAMTYQHFAFVAYAHLANAAARHGADLWNMEADDATAHDGLNGKKSLKLMMDAAAHFAFADSTMAAIKDSGPQGRSFVQPFYADFADFYREHYAHDARHLEALESLARAHAERAARGAPSHAAAPPEGPFALNGLTRNGSSLFPSSGYAVLRQDAHSLDAPAATFVFGPYGGGHGHPDKLSITLYAFGEHMLPETGRYEYGDPLQQSWAKQTLAHNTVAVDRASHKPMHVPGMSMWAEAPAGDTGALKEFIAEKNFQLTRATCDTAVDGVILDRTVALFGGALIDIFDVSSSRARTFDYALHVNAAYAGGNIGLSEYAKSLGRDFGYQHLENVRAAEREAGAAWSSTWRTPGGHGMLIAAFGDGRLAAVADAPGNPPDTHLPLLLLRDRGERARFVTVVLPYENPDTPESVATAPGPPATYFEPSEAPAPVSLLLRNRDREYALALAPGGVLYEWNGWMRTDARTAAADMSGQEHLFLKVSRINHGGPGLAVNPPLDSLTLSHRPGEFTKLDMVSDSGADLRIGDEMIFSITADCARPGLRVNGEPRPLPKALDMRLGPGQTTVEFFCE